MKTQSFVSDGVSLLFKSMALNIFTIKVSSAVSFHVLGVSKYLSAEVAVNIKSNECPTFRYTYQGPSTDLCVCSVVPDSLQPCGLWPHYGIFQATILEWVIISYSRGSSPLPHRTRVFWVSCIGRGILYHWATWEAQHGPRCLEMVDGFYHF